LELTYLKSSRDRDGMGVELGAIVVTCARIEFGVQTGSFLSQSNRLLRRSQYRGRCQRENNPTAKDGAVCGVLLVAIQRGELMVQDRMGGHH